MDIGRYVGVPTTWINRQEQNTQIPVPYGSHVDRFSPKTNANILRAKIFL